MNRPLHANRTVPLDSRYPEQPGLTDPSRGGCGGRRRELQTAALAPLDHHLLVVDPLIVRYWLDAFFDEMYTGKPDKWN